MSQTWTPQEQLAAMMRLPWSVKVQRDTLDGSLVAQVQEIPDAIGTGADEKALGKDLWESLSASIECRIAHGDSLPAPAGVVLPWDEGIAPNRSMGGVLRISNVAFSLQSGSLAPA